MCGAKLAILCILNSTIQCVMHKLSNYTLTLVMARFSLSIISRVPQLYSTNTLIQRRRGYLYHSQQPVLCSAEMNRESVMWVL